MKRGKKYKALLKSFDKTKKYTIKEAAERLPGLSTTKFPGTIELHATLQAKSKSKNESVRGSVIPPVSLGGDKKVAVIADASKQKEAKDAGADMVGGEELIKEIQDGKLEFEVLLATPVMMPKIAVLGKVLGPKGLLPNPKNETVTNDLGRVVKSYKAGKVDFKMDEQYGIHVKIGTSKMKPEELEKNITEFLKSIFGEAKNLSVTPFKSITLSPTMGPGVKLDLNNVYSVIS